ncbi:MAG TPA: nucleotidyltransferase [Synergistetes bacterium]|nr:nucleotidyltransferase [Synergistota bacterium]
MAKKHVVGIIAEYNPFHNGHLYHMKRAVETTEAQAVVVVLSSSFVQRGEPAFTDKWNRTDMALKGGASLVIELPVAFSCHNAGVFGSAAVDLLFSTGVVTDLSFGMEDTEAPLEQIAKALIAEPPEFKKTLKALLAEGFSYAEARATAADVVIPGARSVLSSPNNTLALEYVSRIVARDYCIRPLPVKRLGEGYHSETLDPFASASLVRKSVRSFGKVDAATEALPEWSQSLIELEISRGRCLLSLDLYWRILSSILIREDPETMAGHAEMKEGMENLLAAKARHCKSFDDFTGACTSRRYPKSRIQRHAAHVLLNYGHRLNRRAQREGPPYIRVLGFDDKGAEILRSMRETALLPVVFHPRGRPGTYQRDIADLEYRASAIWENIVSSPDHGRESRKPPVRPDLDPCR